MGGRRGQDWRTEPRLCLVLSPHLAPRAEGPQEQQLLLFPFPRTAHSSGPGLHARCPLCLPDSALLILTHSSDLGRCHFPWEAFPDPDQVSLPPSAPPAPAPGTHRLPLHLTCFSLQFIHSLVGWFSKHPAPPLAQAGPLSSAAGRRKQREAGGGRERGPGRAADQGGPPGGGGLTPGLGEPAQAKARGWGGGAGTGMQEGSVAGLPWNQCFVEEHWAVM